MRQALLLFAVLLACVPIALGATVQGTVYDEILNEVDGAVVSVDSTPEQLAVAKEGKYAFELEAGEYIVRAIFVNDEELYYERNVRIEDPHGVYRIDLILLPNDEDFNIDDINPLFPEEEGVKKTSTNNRVIGIIILAVIIISFIHWRKKRKGNNKEEDIPKEEDELIKKMIEFIKKEGGRVTQKDMRKEFPLSEAKISLVITELESTGKVKKIKRGRGNVIVLHK